MSEEEVQKSGHSPPKPGWRGGLRRHAGRILVWLLLGLGLAFYFRQGCNVGGPDRTTIAYSDFRGEVEAGNVESVVVQGQRLEGSFKEPITRQTGEGESTQYERFVTFVPSFGDDELMTLLAENGVEVQTRPERTGCSPILLVSLLPMLLLVGFGYLFMRRMASRGQNLMSIGKSRAKLYDRRTEETHFDDVAGLESAKQELKEIVEFLKDPERFHSLGGELPKGVLLLGPPGTGKTLLARAVAGEADVPFFSITGSDFMEMFVGVGASRVRNLFDDAKKASPSIIFIDELDSIGRQRGAGLGGGHDEREQTLNQLLSELDGFEPTESVIVMAATNRPDILDPALLRPGRFDRRITVNLPSARDRLRILEIHARDKPLANDVDLERIADGTPGLSGAELENILNEAALIAARQDKQAVARVDIEEARDKILLGLKRRGLVLQNKELELLAYHEGGHAVIAALLPNTDPIHKVTIVPRGRSMGVTQQLPERDKYIYEREYMLDRITVMMGGRAAEQLVFDTATSGAEDDLQQATKLARKMVLDWGMSEELGHMAAGGQSQQVFLGEEIAQQRNYSEETAREIDLAVRRIVDDAFQRALDTLEENRDTLDEVADLLLEKEEISGEEVLQHVRQ